MLKRGNEAVRCVGTLGDYLLISVLATPAVTEVLPPRAYAAALARRDTLIEYV